MKLTKRHCMLCEAEGREQIGGVFIVACKQYDCCNVIADETEADAYVGQLEALREACEWLFELDTDGVLKYVRVEGEGDTWHIPEAMGLAILEALGGE